MTDSGEESGIELALQTLRALPEPPTIAKEVEDDVDALTDLLLDHAPEIDNRHLLYCLTCLLATEFDRLVETYVEAEHLLLEVGEVSEAAVAKVYLQRHPGRRKRPFSSWKHVVVRDVVEEVRFDPKCALYAHFADGTPRERMLSALAVALNRMESTARHMAWLSWVEQRTIADISSITRCPLEHVELVLEELVNQLMISSSEKTETMTTPTTRSAGPGSGVPWKAVNHERTRGHPRAGPRAPGPALRSGA